MQGLPKCPQKRKFLSSWHTWITKTLVYSPLKTKISRNYIQIYSSYRSVNPFKLSYTNQWVNTIGLTLKYSLFFLRSVSSTRLEPSISGYRSQALPIRLILATVWAITKLAVVHVVIKRAYSISRMKPARHVSRSHSQWHTTVLWTATLSSATSVVIKKGDCHLHTTSIRPPPSFDVNVGLSADTSQR